MSEWENEFLHMDVFPKGRGVAVAAGVELDCWLFVPQPAAEERSLVLVAGSGTVQRGRIAVTVLLVVSTQ